MPEEIQNLTIEQKRTLLKQKLQQKASQSLAQQTQNPSHLLIQSGDQIPPESYVFQLFPEFQALKQQFELLPIAGVANPYFRVNEVITGATTQIEGRTLLSFSSYNYLGLSGDPRVQREAIQAIEKWGTSPSASRVATGEKPVHKQLEKELAEFIGTEDALVLVSGHATNVTIIGHLMRPQDLILYDELSHNCIIQGAILSGARRIPFPHEDWQALDKMLTENRHRYERALITIEGVYSMDGDIAALDKFVELKKKHKALLLVDEAHSIGTIGNTGRGVGEYHSIDRKDVDIWMGTMSKSFASCGGYVAGSAELIQYLKYTTPGFVYSVGLTPSNAGAALGALRVMREEPWRVEKLQANSRLFLEKATSLGLNCGASKDSPVIPIILGSSVLSLQLADALFREGVNVQPVLYPAVAEDATRLRFFITAEHNPEQLTFTAELTAQLLKKLKS
jgi:8-amino-7-oxononanoate synthase